MNREENASAVRVENLVVQYARGALALQGINLNIRPGLFGLLGPNGAGKTTLMKVLATLLRPTAGRAEALGREVTGQARMVRKNLGYLPQEFRPPAQLKTWEVLDYYAILNGMDSAGERKQRIAELLDTFNLTQYRNRKAKKLSGGSIRRLGMAQALLTEPPFLILDEPTAGLDPAERSRFRNMIAEWAGERVTLLSTHIVADIESACAELAILNQGRIEYSGSREGLLRRSEGRIWQTEVETEMYERLRAEKTITAVSRSGSKTRVRLIAETREDESWEPVEPNLEDAYHDLLGRVGHEQN